MFRSVGRLRRFAIAAVVSGLACAACSTGDPERTSVTARRPSAEAVELTVTSHDTIGFGRALLTASNGDSTVVATAGALFVVPADDAPLPVDRFDAGSRPVGIALSPSGDRAVVALDMPPTLRWYDLSAPAIERSVELRIGEPVVQLEYGTDGSLMARTPTNLLLWPPNSSGDPVSFTDGSEQLGQAAFTSSGSVVVPVRGTTDLVIGSASQAATERHTLVGIEGTLIDAASSSSGAVAVSTTTGRDEFERSDGIELLDATLQPIARIDSGQRTAPGSWVVTERNVVVAGPDGATVHNFDGTTEPPLAGVGGVPVAALYDVGTAVVTLLTDGTVISWDQSGWRATALESGARFGSGTVNVDRGSSTVTMVAADGSVSAWRADTGEVVLDERRFATGELTDLAANADATRFASTSDTGRIVVYDSDFNEIAEIVDDDRRIDAVGFVPGSSDIITARAQRVRSDAFDDTVTRWNTDTGEAVFRMQGAAAAVPGCGFFFNRVRFAPDGSMVAVVSHTFEVSLISSATGDVLHVFEPHGSSVFDVAFSRDGEFLVTTSDDATVRVWDTHDATLVAEYRAAQGGYQAIAMVDDDLAMAVSDITGRLSIIDLVTGDEILPLAGADLRTSQIAASSDGTLVAAPLSDGAIGVWSTGTGELLERLAGSSEQIEALEFVAGDVLIAASSDGTIHRWSFAASE